MTLRTETRLRLLERKVDIDRCPNCPTVAPCAVVYDDEPLPGAIACIRCGRYHAPWRVYRIVRTIDYAPEVA